MDIKIKFVDYSYAKVEAEQHIISEMRDYFSFRIEGYKFNKKYKMGLWDGYIRPMDYLGNLPQGLVGLAKKFAKNLDYTIEIDEQLEPKPHWSWDEFEKWISKFDIYDGDKRITPYEEQKKCIFNFFNQQRCITEMPTSGGKSLIAALSAKRHFELEDSKVLIVVPTVLLVNQFTDELVNYRLFDDEDIHKISSGKSKVNDRAKIYISTWQSAIKQPKWWLEQFGMLINDECHDSTGKSLDSIIKTMRHTKYKQGLTGTLRDGKANMLQYIGSFGHPYKPTTTRKMMDQGKISKLKIKSIFIRYPLEECKDFVASKSDYQKEIKFIKEHTKRNNWVAKLATKLGNRKENVLVLFKHKAHGKDLYKRIQRYYGKDKVIYADGDTHQNDRDEMKRIANSEDGVIVVASYGILSTGVSIKKLHHAIFAHPTKSKITTIQSIGRILRKHSSKSVAVLWDVIDHLALPTKKGAKNKWKNQNYALKHGVERVKIYNQEKHDYDIKTIKI